MKFITIKNWFKNILNNNDPLNILMYISVALLLVSIFFPALAAARRTAKEISTEIDSNQQAKIERWIEEKPELKKHVRDYLEDGKIQLYEFNHLENRYKSLTDKNKYGLDLGDN